jgi:pimeloyl-ACP methyl ester carboxylesterase
MEDVVLVHGQAFDARCWGAVQGLLHVPSRCLELPGHGAAPEPAAWSSTTFAEAVLAGRGSSRVVVGHSLGALAVLGAACLDPAAFDVVVLIGLPGEPTPELAAMQLGFAAALDGGVWPEPVIDAVVGLWCDPAFAALPETRARLMALLDPDAARVARLCRVVAAREPLIPRLPASLPRCVVLGSRDDRAAPLADAEPLIAACRAEVVELAGGHLPMLEQPAVLAEHLRAVLGVGAPADCD